MNTGAEGVETALKLARKWAYERKGVPEDKVRGGGEGRNQGGGEGRGKQEGVV